MRGRLSRAAELAAQATAAAAAGEQRPGVQLPNPAALAALAWVHVEHNELRRARNRLKQVDAALGVSPDKLIGAVAFLAAARSALAEGDLEPAGPVRGEGTIGVAGSGVARPPAEPGRVPGMPGGR